MLCSIFAVFGFPKLHGAFLFAIYFILPYLSQVHVTWRFFDVAILVSNCCAYVLNLVVFSFKSLFGFQVLVLSHLNIFLLTLIRSQFLNLLTLGFQESKAVAKNYSFFSIIQKLASSLLYFLLKGWCIISCKGSSSFTNLTHKWL